MRVPPVIFCSLCGGALTERFLELEQRLRSVCTRCGSVTYKNPRVLVSTLVSVDDDVLLCRRANPPAAGRWALPGGFLECDEALQDAAARETFEETGISLDPQQLHLHSVSTLTDISEVYVGFRAELDRRPMLVCGMECTEVGFVCEAQVPWPDLAYADIANYLRAYFRELRTGERAIHFSRLDATAVASRSYRISQLEEIRRPRTTRGAPG